MSKKEKRFRRTFNVQVLKKEMSYSSEEIADLFKVHIGTVYAWSREGMKKIDNNKPYLFLGRDIRDFLRERQKKRKVKCKVNEFFCFKCREPRISKNNSVVIEIHNQRQLNVKGKCIFCGCTINKRDMNSKLNWLLEIFEVQKIVNQHLLGFNPTIVKINQEEENKNETM